MVPTFVHGPVALTVEDCHCKKPPAAPVTVNVGDPEIQYEVKGVDIVPPVVLGAVVTVTVDRLAHPALGPAVLSTANTE
jgi:hypothetical protein